MNSLSFPMSLYQSIILLFLLLPTNYGGNSNTSSSTNITDHEFCPPTTCGQKGPQIRFPFRLGTQSVFCGLPGFELSCFNNNTLLHLPSPSKSNGTDFQVQDISYLDSTITIIDADETTCPVKALLSLNLTSSKFSFSKYWYIYQNITIVNCTEKIEGSNQYEVGPIDCLSDDNNFVFVTSEYMSVDVLPSYCCMSQTISIPTSGSGYRTSTFNDSFTKFLETGRMVMAWEALDGCRKCEKSGNFCGFNFTTNSTICVKIKNKGNQNIL